MFFEKLDSVCLNASGKLNIKNNYIGLLVYCKNRPHPFGEHFGAGGRLRIAVTTSVSYRVYSFP